MIKPNQVPTEAERALLEQAEKALDEHLLAHYKHQPLYVGPLSKPSMPIELWRLLWDKYRRNGWDVYFNSETVDGAPSGPYFRAAEAAESNSDVKACAS